MRGERGKRDPGRSRKEERQSFLTVRSEMAMPEAEKIGAGRPLTVRGRPVSIFFYPAAGA